MNEMFIYLWKYPCCLYSIIQYGDNFYIQFNIIEQTQSSIILYKKLFFLFLIIQWMLHKAFIFNRNIRKYKNTCSFVLCNQIHIYKREKPYSKCYTNPVYETRKRSYTLAVTIGVNLILIFS